MRPTQRLATASYAFHGLAASRCLRPKCGNNVKGALRPEKPAFAKEARPQGCQSGLDALANAAMPASTIAADRNQKSFRLLAGYIHAKCAC